MNNETLRGNLSQLKLVDILRILNHNKRTGKLSLQFRNGSADIYFLNGDIIHAKTNDMFGENVIYEVLGIREGTFAFFPNISVKNPTINRPTSEIIDKAEFIDEDWEEVSKVIPDFNLVFKMTSGSPKEISLNAMEWNVLRHINGKDSVKDIAEKVELNLLDVCKVFVKLYNAGLIEVAGESIEEQAPAVSGVDPYVFAKISQRLAEVVGPLAEIIVDDAIKDLGEDKFAFPKEKLPDLVDLLSKEINDPQKLIDFQKDMLNLIKNI